MKLRRAMAAAAATAVIAPLALLSAPAAFATGETPDTSTSSPATSADSSPAETPDDTTTDTSAPTDDQSTPAEDDTSSPSTDTDTKTPSDPAEDDTPSTDPSTPSTGTSSPPASPSPSASESAPAEEDVELCTDEEGNSTAELSADLRSGLSGLPEKIVAGSGWTGFSFNVSNRGDDEIKDIKPLIGVAAVGWDAKDYSGRITVQVFNRATGNWDTLADAAGEGGTFAAFSLGAGQSVSYKLRLSVSGSVPDALGITGGFAEYADDDGCWIADDSNGWIYFFDILAAGSDPGKPNDAKPQTGGKVELDEVKDVKVTGSLAETGSSSALPMIGLVGGAALVAGAGAVFVVRRRKAGAEA